MENNQYPSVANLACPKCGKKDFRVISIKGSLAKIGTVAAFGALANLALDSKSKGDFEIKPVKYQCLGCKNKFEALPLVAEPDELLETPCRIKFHRQKSALGMAVSQQVYMNGVKMGNVGNGKELEFQTFIKENTLFVTDQTGTAFPGTYKFTAENGGTEQIEFKRKFLK
ncbi:MAG: hypothetical protein IJH71_07400 [Eubacterium sp.]|nr:hypothetical protein [Eubacterium sp.]